MIRFHVSSPMPVIAASTAPHKTMPKAYKCAKLNRPTRNRFRRKAKGMPAYSANWKAITWFTSRVLRMMSAYTKILITGMAKTAIDEVHSMSLAFRGNEPNSAHSLRKNERNRETIQSSYPPADSAKNVRRFSVGTPGGSPPPQEKITRE